MARLTVTPQTAGDALARLGPGDEAVFAPGTYRQPLRLTRRAGTATQPIVLRGLPGAVISQGRSADDFRLEANAFAKDMERQNRFPGLYPRMLEARLLLQHCRHVVVQDLAFEQSWPTHIAIDDGRDIVIRGCRMTDATFAIAASGQRTYGITIEGCCWVQDREPGRLWQRIPWWRVHGDRRDDLPEVDVTHDWRLFDGDFFRGEEIRGGLTIRRCSVAQAFNAIHLFNDDYLPELAVDVEVHDCSFSEIRDNVVETERMAQNWWFHHNELHNCHKPLSFECRQSRFFYVFANRCWFSSRQGTGHPLDHNAGGVFKFGKEAIRPYGPHYVFHNSVASRGDYARKGLLPGLQHFNNAVRLIGKGDPGFEDDPTVFGDLKAPAGAIDKRFTTEWGRYGIGWRNDVVLSPQWPAALREAGYALAAPDLGPDPQFLDPFAGNLETQPGSPCRGNACGATVELPDGATWTLPAGADIGACQTGGRFAGPAFRPIADPRAGM